MDELHNTLKRVLTTPPARSQALRRVRLLHDVELGSHALYGTQGWLAESDLKEIRTLVMLMAGRRIRWDEGVVSAYFSDRVDWLLARIIILGIIRLRVDASGFVLLDEANRRLTSMCDELGLVHAPVMPVLCDDLPAGVTDGWCPAPVDLGPAGRQSRLDAWYQAMKDKKAGA